MDLMTAPAAETPRERLVGVALLLVTALFFVWFLFLRGSDEAKPPERRSAQSYAQEYGGDVGRYQAVLRLTNCTDLARMFRDGKANFDANAVGQREVWLGQMAVTDDRMQALGCP